MQALKKQIMVQNKAISYLVIGHGAPVILIHGLSGSTTWWKYNIAALANKYTVYLFDLPGFGAMRKFGNDFTLEKGAEWLVECLKTLGIRKAHFIGHSMGGFISIKIASRYPELVDKLILVSSIGIPTGRSLTSSIQPLANAARNMTVDFLSMLFYDATRAGAITLIKTAKDVLVANAHADFRMIHSPTFIIWGKRDKLSPLEHADILKNEIPNSQKLILNAGHVPMFEKANEFNSAVLKFLS